MEFSGVNTNSIVVMDNYSIHHVLYSRYLMPIELCLSNVKQFLKAHEDMAQASVHVNGTLLLRAAFASITSEDCSLVNLL